MARGGKRAGAGRRPGSKSKTTLEAEATIGQMAKAHTTLALKTLVRIASKSDSDAASKAAADSILDRAWGRPTQSVEHAGAGGGPIKHDLSGLADEQLAQLKAILGSITVAGGDKRRDTPQGGEA